MQEEVLAADNRPTAHERGTAHGERRELRAGPDMRDGHGISRNFALAFFVPLAVVYAAIGYGLYLAATALF